MLIFFKLQTLPSYEQIQEELKKGPIEATDVSAVEDLIEEFQKTYSVEELRQPTELLPPGVDPCKKEVGQTNQMKISSITPPFNKRMLSDIRDCTS